MVPNFYEVNVSLNGRHLFATHERSITTREQAAKLLGLLVAKFPHYEGYKVTLSAHCCEIREVMCA